MNTAKFAELVGILDRSRGWDPETLERCPKFFLMLRGAWIDVKENDDDDKREELAKVSGP